MNGDSLKLGVTASALGGDVRSSAQRAREAGFEGIQFDAWSPGLALPELSTSGRREFLRLLTSQNQRLVGLRLDLGNHGFGPGADIDLLLHRFEQVMETAAGMQSPLVCVDAGPMPAPAREKKARPKIPPDQLGLILLPDTAMKAEPANAEPHDPPIDPSVFATTDAAMAALGALADRYNVVIAFRSELASLAALERALKAARCPWFGIDLDPVAVLRDEWNMDELFSRMGALVRHVRGRDAAVGTDRRTKPTPIGGGSTSWGSLLADLDAAGYRQWITIDPTELTDRLGAAVVGRKRLLAFSE